MSSLFLSDTTVFSQGDQFQQVLAKITLGGGGGIFRGGYFCVTMPCFYHLQRSYEEHGVFFNSWHWEQNSVLVASVEVVIKTCCDIM